MMNTRNTLIAAAASALLALSAGTAFAASGDAQTAAPTSSAVAPAGRQHRQMNQEKWQQKRAERARQLHEKLQLSAAQEPAWEALQKAMQPQRHARLDRAEMQKLTTPERIDRMRALREQRSAAAEQRGQAIKSFYAQLTPEQQKVFDAQAMQVPRGAYPGHHRGGQRAATAS